MWGRIVGLYCTSYFHMHELQKPVYQRIKWLTHRCQIMQSLVWYGRFKFLLMIICCIRYFEIRRAVAQSDVPIIIQCVAYTIYWHVLTRRSSSALAQLYGTDATLEHHHFNHAVMILNSEVCVELFILALSHLRSLQHSRINSSTAYYILARSSLSTWAIPFRWYRYR